MRDERKLLYAEEFEESLQLTVDYLRLCDVSEYYILGFVSDLRVFIHEKIAPQPEFHMEYQYKRTPEKSFRRAISKKKYYVIYKVYDGCIEFRLFISSKRDLTKISIQN